MTDSRKGADLQAVVGFHSSLTAPEPAQPNDIKALDRCRELLK